MATHERNLLKMAFTTDFSQIKEHPEFKAQPYEMIVFDAREETNRNGNQCIVIDYVVRNDIRQDMQNMHLWDRQYKTSTGKYHNGILMGKAKAFGIKEGKQYESFEAFLNDFKGKTAKVTVKLTEYGAEARYTNPSALPECHHVWKEKTEATPAAYIGPEDLPF
jgi:hypothetical protein